jgi:general secretion pathway protein N
LSSLTATRERPIFSPSRRPPTAPVVSAAPPPPPAPAEPGHPALTLIGTIVGDADHIGIFLDQVSRSVIRLKVRQEHAGWVLVAVEERQVTFEKGTRMSRLALPARGSDGKAPSQGARPPTD